MGRIFQTGADAYIERRSASTTIYTAHGETRVELYEEAVAPLVAGLIVVDHEDRARVAFHKLEDLRLVFTETHPGEYWSARLPGERLAVIWKHGDARNPDPFTAWICDAREDGPDNSDAESPYAQPTLVGPQNSYTWMGAVARCADMAIALVLQGERFYR